MVIYIVSLCLLSLTARPGAQKSGWSYDASTQILYPSKIITEAPPGQMSLSRVISDYPNMLDTEFRLDFSTLATFDLVADSVARLEG